ncbi:hypothetical protein KB879_01340 [Cupriavidus sp. KK10]|jgi:hypothetical protein|uniref:hypothetical protein n=1 Tax=Cupriavidus sp. KK10 TaxID=1478019 RepID=UPI001BA4A8AF|nr:hypothetical protein [Cupriavidus sp. KK10]QUN28649.1 hypothetical protein KB879_01340 [Cupriavidus sp. KK10]
MLEVFEPNPTAPHDTSTLGHVTMIMPLPLDGIRSVVGELCLEPVVQCRNQLGI